MNRDLGVWTNEDTALVLIDYQKEQLESIRSETSADLIELHARWLARTAKSFDVPVVLSTVGVEYGFNSPVTDVRGRRAPLRLQEFCSQERGVVKSWSIKHHRR